MKKLLNVLGIISLSVMGAANVVSCTKENNVTKFDLYVHDDVVYIYNEMNKLIESNETNLETYLVIHRQVPKTIYKINTVENLYKFMFAVDQFHFKISTLEASESQLDEIKSIKFAIEDAVKFWQSNTDVNELAGSYIELAKREKEAASKLYYAFNQMSSKLIIEDIEQYQPYRIRQIEIQTAISNTWRENDLINQYLEEYSRMEEWQARLALIFDNWINEANRLQSKFMDTWDSYFGSPEKFFNKMFQKAEIFVKGTIRSYFDEFIETVGIEASSWLTDEVKADYENSILDEIESDKSEILPGEIPKWILEINEDGPSLPNDPNEEAGEITNEVWKEAVISQIDIEFEKKPEDKTEFEEKLKVVSKYLKQAYAIDSLIFGEIHNAAKEFKDFAQGTVPRLSADVRDSFESAGIDYTSDLDKKISEVAAIASEICDQIIQTFVPAGDMIVEIKGLAFATVDKIVEWYRDFDVFRNSGKVIESIEIAKKNATIIPDDKIKNYEKYKKQQSENQKKLVDLNNELIDIEEKLASSKFDELQSELIEFNKFFYGYKDFLDIDTYEIMSSITIELNPVRYWNEQLKAYNDIVLRRIAIFEKLSKIEDLESQIGDKWIEIQRDNTKLEKIREFVNGRGQK